MDRHIAPRVKKLIGVDVSGEMIRAARERLLDLSNVEFLEGDGWTLDPIPDDHVDLVFSHIVLHHTPRTVASSYLAEAFRVLRPGGDLVFQMAEAGPGTPPDPPEDDTYHLRFYREPDLARELQESGFEYRGCLRAPVHAQPVEFNYLRLHARKPAAGAF